MASTFSNLNSLRIHDKIDTSFMAITDFRSVLQNLDKYQPDKIYNLAVQRSVGLSFEQLVETMESIAIGTLNLLDAIRLYGKPIHLYNAGSSECFGDSGTFPAAEETPLGPEVPIQ
jgi:GDPmannose 4,6-dehydratase